MNIDIAISQLGVSIGNLNIMAIGDVSGKMLNNTEIGDSGASIKLSLIHI